LSRLDFIAVAQFGDMDSDPIHKRPIGAVSVVNSTPIAMQLESAMDRGHLRIAGNDEIVRREAPDV
jgi:hypothetical protein